MPSKSEARRLIRAGGARLDDKPVAEETETLAKAFLEGRGVKLSAGKKRHVLVRIA